MTVQDEQQLRRIFTDDGTAKDLVEYAQKLAKDSAAAELSKTQIRNIFGTVKSLQALSATEWQRQARGLTLLIPKIRYAAARDPKLAPLVAPLTQAITYVIDESAAKSVFEGRFQRFCEFFEAIVAFHYVAHEETKKQTVQRRGGRS